jgi:hypothetical protein
VLLLLLLLSEGACAVTFLPANRARIGGARKSETKWGSDVSSREIFFSLPLSCAETLFFSQRPSPQRLLKLGVASSKKKKKKLFFQHCYKL